MKKRKKFSLQWQALTSTLSTTLVLVMFGLVVLTVLTSRKLSDRVKEDLHITVTMVEDVTDKQCADLQNILRTEAYVKEVKFISKDQVLREQVDAMGADPTDFLKANPFQSELEVSLMPEYTCADSLQWIAEQIKEYNRDVVSDVMYQTDLVESLNANLQRVTLIFSVVALLLLVISVALINSTVRLSVYSRRFLIHTMKLVGASWSFIRRPFMLRSMWIGLVAALMADGLLLGMIQMLMNYDASVINYIPVQNQVIMVASVIVCGLVITLLCTYVSVSHFLRMSEGKMNN